MLAGAYFEEHSSGPSTTPAERDSLLILETEIEGRYIKLVAWMIFEIQLFETQIMVAVIWTTKVSPNDDEPVPKHRRDRGRRVVASDTPESDDSGQRGHGRGRELGLEMTYFA